MGKFTIYESSIYKSSGVHVSFAVKDILQYYWLLLSSKISFGIGAIVILIFVSPAILYFIQKEFVTYTSRLLYKTAESKIPTINTTLNKKPPYLPPYDPMLPVESRIKISSIGVDAQIYEAGYEDIEDALRKGVWRAGDFGIPPQRERPIILAAHRFGYLSWSNKFRRENSFYNLPKLKVGNKVEIIWSQRKYVYEIYAEEQGEEIVDYSGDLILYTCESLNSPIRIFKYARLLEV